MATADELYLLHQKSKEYGDQCLKSWKVYFKWLKDIRTCLNAGEKPYLYLKNSANKITHDVDNDQRTASNESDSTACIKSPLSEISSNDLLLKENQKFLIPKSDDGKENTVANNQLKSIRSPGSIFISENLLKDNDAENFFKVPSALPEKCFTQDTLDEQSNLVNPPRRSKRTKKKQSKSLTNRNAEQNNENIDSVTVSNSSQGQTSHDSVHDPQNVMKTCEFVSDSVPLSGKDEVESASGLTNEVDNKNIDGEDVILVDSKSRPTRSKRTNKRMAQEHIQDVPSIKKSKLSSSNSNIDESTCETVSNSSCETTFQPVVIKEIEMPKIISKPEKSKDECPIRVTRSKARAPKRSINHEESEQNIVDVHLPYTIPNNPSMVQPEQKYSPIPTRTTRSKARKPSVKDSPKRNIVENVSKVNSPVFFSKLKVEGSNAKKVVTSGTSVSSSEKMGKGKTPIKSSSVITPFKSTISSQKLLGSKGLFSSGRLVSRHSQNRVPLLAPSPLSSSRLLMPSSELKRATNIVEGPSFVQKIHPAGPSREEMEEMKLNTLMKRREKEEDAKRKKEELMRAKMEEQKRKNEEKSRRVQEAREAREKRMAEAKEAQEKERRLREEKQKQKNEDIRQNLLKKQVEQRQKEEQKLNEKKRQEEEKKRYEEEKRRNEERKRQEEEKRRAEHQKMVEMKKLEEQKQHEKLIKEERQRQKEEQRRNEELLRAEMREQKLKLESNQQLQAIQESRKKLEEEKKLIEQRQEVERVRLAKEASRIAREKKELEDLRKREAQRSVAQDKNNDTLHAASGSALDSTYTKCSDPQSYDMTPVPIKPPPRVDENDYGIDEIESDDSTDDDSRPKKVVPLWARPRMLKEAVIKQHYFNKFDVDDIFPPSKLFRMINLDTIFTKRRSRFTKRTSSALWDTPPHKVFN